MSYRGDDYLLHSNAARTRYHDYAETIPASDRKFDFSTRPNLRKREFLNNRLKVTHLFLAAKPSDFLATTQRYSQSRPVVWGNNPVLKFNAVKNLIPK